MYKPDNEREFHAVDKLLPRIGVENLREVAAARLPTFTSKVLTTRPENSIINASTHQLVGCTTSTWMK
jgi:hypothetical protein